MEDLIKNFKSYIYENISIKTDVKILEEKNQLPLAIRESYEIFSCYILNEKLLLLVPLYYKDLTPAKLGKHIDFLYKKFNNICVFLDKTISTYNRQRYIQRKIPFVIPGNQMYLPMFGMDLRNYYKKVILNKNKKMNPSAQIVILHILYADNDNNLGVNLLAEKLGYSSMSITRAFDEIESLGLAETEISGRKRFLKYYVDKKRLWEKAKLKMKSPVKIRKYIEKLPPQLKTLKSGLTALSEYTMLSENATEVYAFSQSDWKKAESEYSLKVIPFAEKECCEIEIWYYDPKKLTTGGKVDALSLYLELCDYSDERIKSALEELMETVKW